ncbi:MAG: hypothetical protein EKK52_06125 [Burkholderiales bacterium]|uniref:hypothetical protein n=1 Tax=Roseateles sp. TaxID=1971397 RepID=UPI000F933FF6|nr:MAG: hypothetical protein EKK52_06125 [Burkholderiales bacterium]
MQDVRKIDMAVQQLQDALEAYFKQRYHSALVLAAASEQLFAGYMNLHKMEPAYSSIRRAVVKIANDLKSRSGAAFEPTTEKDIGGLLNRAYNHSHHAGKTDLEVRMNPKFEAQEAIDRAISNFDSLLLTYDLPEVAGAQRFIEESLAESRFDADVEELLGPVVCSLEA